MAGERHNKLSLSYGKPSEVPGPSPDYDTGAGNVMTLAAAFVAILGGKRPNGNGSDHAGVRSRSRSKG